MNAPLNQAKAALMTTAAVLLTIYLLRKVPTTRKVVDMALS